MKEGVGAMIAENLRPSPAKSHAKVIQDPRPEGQDDVGRGGLQVLQIMRRWIGLVN